MSRETPCHSYSILPIHINSDQFSDQVPISIHRPNGGHISGQEYIPNGKTVWLSLICMHHQLEC